MRSLIFLCLATLLPALADVAPGKTPAQEFAAATQDLRAQRVTRLTTPDGWLTLIGRHLLRPGENSVGSVADNSIQLAAGPPYLGTVTLAADGKVTFVPAPSAMAEIDGSPAGPGELVYRGEKPTHVTFGTANFYIMERGDSLYLRVRDRAADRLRHFAGLEYFSADPAWRIEAQWVPFDPPRQVNITNVLGQVSPAAVPGKAVFTRDSQTCELWPIVEEGDELFFILADQTTGKETYPGGRFLYAAAPRDGKVILDFNLAQNPPCAFTPFATCPLPPKENRLPVRVSAGEKIYRGESH